MTGSGIDTLANDAIVPPGYSLHTLPLARGHLLGRQLGVDHGAATSGRAASCRMGQTCFERLRDTAVTDSGDVSEHLVARYQNDINTARHERSRTPGSAGGRILHHA
jgi:hypothetical protein